MTRPTLGAAAACVLAAVALLAAVAPLHARDAIITLKDGRQLRGELVGESDKFVTLRIATVETPFPREDVQSVELIPSLEEQYRSRRSTIGDDNFEERLALVTWLHGEKAYELALRELEDMAERFPREESTIATHRQAIQFDMRNQEAQRPPRPERRTPPRQGEDGGQQDPGALDNGAAGAGTGEAAGDPATRLRIQELGNRRLTPEQLNLIRVYEIDPTTRPRVTVPREVMETVFRNYSHRDEVPKGREAQNAARAWPGWQQLLLLFNLRARELYPEVTVHDDPQVIRDFRIGIHQNYVLNYCGTTLCHGGTEGGDFFVFLTEPNSDRTVYSNFLILDRYGEQPAKRGFVLDRERPERSYLAQYMLPRQSAATPHPDVPGWRPGVRGVDDPRYQMLVRWIQSLGPQRQKYPIQWDAPRPGERAGAQTQPADGEGDGADAGAGAGDGEAGQGEPPAPQPPTGPQREQAAPTTPEPAPPRPQRQPPAGAVEGR